MSAIPAELRARDQWVVWRFEERDGKGTKVPYTAEGARASSTDRATWTSFTQAVAAEGFDGIGFVFTDEDPFCGVDLDRCLAGENGDLHPSVLKIVRLLDSYTEHSVSGTGLHVLVRAKLNGTRRRTGKTPWGAEFEVYDQGRYFCMTGQALAGAAPTIEERQPQLDRVLAVIFPKGRRRAPAEAQHGDPELLERAFGARNGPKFEALYRGDTSGYGSASEADLALVNMIAFWAGPDPERIDGLFRASGLMRPKWDRTDYRERTIQAALEGRTDYFSEQSRGLNSVDSVPEFAKNEGRDGVTEFPYKELRNDSVAPVDAETASPSPDSVDSVPFALSLREFIAERSESPAVLIGDESEVILSRAGLLLLFAKGGRGKTSLILDMALHAAAGVDWLGFAIPRPLRVLFAENEGSREMFRAKVEARLAGWEHDEIPDSRLFFHTFEWGALTFADREHARRLREFIEEKEIDVVIGDPLDSLGLDGVGSPEDTRAFMGLMTRVGLFRDVGFVLLHHPRKEGAQDELDEAAGAWGGKPDTMLRLERKDGNRARLSFPKLRWSRRGSRPAYILTFDPATEGFAVAHEEEDEERDYRAEIEELMGDRKPRIAKEIAAPKKEGGIGASEKRVLAELEQPPKVFVSSTGDEAKALGRSPQAVVWRMVAHISPPEPAPRDLFAAGGDEGAT